MSWFSRLLPKSVTATLTRQDIRKALGRNGMPVGACDEIDAMLARYAPGGLKVTIKL